ncbi:hypothetical protein [Lacticaseibacillus brantae]|uniref:hypothetical protein n=1 Tax=Lacticaseibacillus brantae TaxID=943673 RepID=UPI0012EEB324|nr:hypothetical protein [Lacticaseibacillus brantae]
MEHLAALVVLTLVVGWLLILNTYYHQQVLPLQQYAIAQQMAIAALKSGDRGLTSMVFVDQKGTIRMKTTEVEVILNDKTYLFKAPASIQHD